MAKSVTIFALIVGLTCLLTQVAWGQQAIPVQHPPAGMTAEKPEGSTAGPSGSDVATANNPIAHINAIYFQDYYAPTVSGVPASSNLLNLRSVLVSGRQIVRATLPISSVDDSKGNPQSGLGDFIVFDAIRISPKKSKDVFAVGPMLVAPTATNRFLGQGKWQAGLAAIGLHSLSEESVLVGILTWQHSFAGEDTRPHAQVVTFQPIAALSIGSGYYVRSSGLWSFDIYGNKELIPLGVGFGKVFRTGNAIVNAFIEPQFTVYHSGTGLPSFQLFTGLNFQFRKKTK